MPSNGKRRNEDMFQMIRREVKEREAKRRKKTGEIEKEVMKNGVGL